MSVLIAALAFLTERLFGYPAAMQNAIGHPVEWIGRLITFLDHRLNKKEHPFEHLRLAGFVALILVLAVTAIAAGLTVLICHALPFGFVLEALVASSLLASRQLGRAVRSVGEELGHSLARGRAALQPIVGRDARSLDAYGVARAAIETLSENASDGVIAPLFYLALFGLPGIAFYKAINTADSMLGHLNERYRAFGWAAARLDDIANFVPARLTALLIAGAAFLCKQDAASSRVVARRDAPRQDSPNSGWPEAAMAGALGLKLGGPRTYRGERADLPFMGAGRAEAGPEDIERALCVYVRVNDVALAGLVILALLLARIGIY